MNAIMRRLLCISIAFGLDVATSFAEPPTRSDVWIAGTWTESTTKIMAIKLQPTGMTGFTGRPLTNLPTAQRAKKLAWIERRKKWAQRLDAEALRGYYRVVALGQHDGYVESQLEALKRYLAGGGSLATLGHGDAWPHVLSSAAVHVHRSDFPRPKSEASVIEMIDVSQTQR